MKYNRILKIVVLQVIFLTCTFSVVIAQTNSTDSANIVHSSDISAKTNDSIKKQNTDSTAYKKADDTTSLNTDTIPVINKDTTAENQDTMPRKLRISPSAVTSIVDYFAEDSVTFDLNNSTANLHSNTDLNYEDINLKSDYVEINFAKNELFARGEADTAGTLHGKPVFKQGSYEVKSHEMLYNFESKKGLIRNVITQEGESYLHGEIVKKNEDNTSYIYKGKYTTCDLDCPHFEAGFKKAKVIPNDKVITGPFWLKIASVPIVPIPFGFFPNSSKRQNGLIFPKYGQRVDLGPYLEGIGYYFAIKDKMDYSITATLYMRGAFGVGLNSRYVKRYKFNGEYNIAYSLTPRGEKTTKEYSIAHDIKVYWQHQQDRKAHPTNNFSANIDFKTSTYSKNNAKSDIYDQTQSKAMSVVNFSTSFKGKYSLGVNAELSQDLIKGNLDMKLPQINFGVSQFYPFRKKQRSGKFRWYENISMQYTMDFQNIINTYDSLLLKDFNHAFNNFKTGMSHYIPIKSTIKLFKHINWENSVNLREMWQIKGVKQSWGEYDSIRGNHIKKDTIYGFFPAHDLAISSGISTTLYGMYTRKGKGRVQVIRHTLMPSVSFTYRPSISKSLYGTYHDSIVKILYDSNNIPYDTELTRNQRRYSYIEGSLYSAPLYKSSGKINFSINNKLEMKVSSKKEEGEAFKKVTIFESISISTAYDILADSMRWDPLRISGRTTLFKQIQVSFNLAFDPYIIDTACGYRINKTELKENKRLLRLSSAGGDISFGYNINKELFKSKKEKEKRESSSSFGEWNINLSYTFSYGIADNYDYYRLQHKVDTAIKKYRESNNNNSISISGEFNLTPKWKFGFQSGYNITQKAVVPSEFRIERDLHCWRIMFKWSPFGAYRYFEFGIYAKAGILQDAKYEHKKDLNTRR